METLSSRFWSNVELSHQSGKIARIGPQSLVTSDVEYIKRMNAPRSSYHRSDWYKSVRFVPNEDTLLNMTDDVMHKALRSKMAPGVCFLSSLFHPLWLVCCLLFTSIAVAISSCICHSLSLVQHPEGERASRDQHRWTAYHYAEFDQIKIRNNPVDGALEAHGLWLHSQLLRHRLHHRQCV